MVASLLSIFTSFSSAMASHRERTFIAVKPDGVQRGLCGEVIGRLERKGFQLVACKLLQSSEEKLKKHYEEHKGKPFFQSIVDFMSSGPLLAMVWEGENVVVISRSLIGETRPKDMKPGSLRGDFVVDVGRNIVHGSDSVKSANREIALWFDESELVNWTPSRDKFLYEESL